MRIELSEGARPVYIWPEGSDVEPLKRVVLEMNLPLKIRPFWFDGGAGDRVIAIDAGFPFIVDHAYPKSDEARKKAVLWALGIDELPQAHTVIDKMRSIFGEGVREIVDED